jgi:arylsulfatase A-like enzyme
MYGLVDIAPTFVQLSGAEPRRRLDGRSMLQTLRHSRPGYRYYLIQAAKDHGPPWWWRGVRSSRYVYVRYSDGFQELYDMARDPAQLTNVARRRAYADIRADYAARLKVLKGCAGRSCRNGGEPRG